MYVVYVLDSRIWVNYKGERQILHSVFCAKASTKMFRRGSVPPPQKKKKKKKTYNSIEGAAFSQKAAFGGVCPYMPGFFPPDFCQS